MRETIKEEDSRDSRETDQETTMVEDRMIHTIEIIETAGKTEDIRTSTIIEEINMIIVVISPIIGNTVLVILVETARIRDNNSIEEITTIDMEEINRTKEVNNKVMAIIRDNILEIHIKANTKTIVRTTK